MHGPNIDKTSLELSVIIPVLNEASVIKNTLNSLRALRRNFAEVIVVDGGSTDDTLSIAAKSADQVLTTSSGRAIQMNQGARAASGDYLLFLHADTKFSTKAQQQLIAAIRSQCVWGRFDIRLSGEHAMFRVVETSMNMRSRLTGIATGDQAIFVRSESFHNVGGYPEIALMEDIELSKKLKRNAHPVCLRSKIVTDSRRWEQHGILRTIVWMWSLRLLYYFGVDADLLAKLYYDN